MPSRPCRATIREYTPLVQKEAATVTSTVEAIQTEAREVAVPAGGVSLSATLLVPEAPQGAVVFSHAGSNDLHPRTPQITGALAEAGFATLALDLLTDEEAIERPNLFDAPLLARRLVSATRWLRREKTESLPIAYLGVGTGASAALWAAAGAEAGVFAVVSLGGWPDLAVSQLSLVRAPTLLVVGGADGRVLELNRAALDRLPSCEHELAVVPGATHLFEQHGALEQATELAMGWFAGHLGRRAD